MKGKKQSLIFSYVQKHSGAVIWTGDLIQAIGMAKDGEHGPLVTAHNRKSRRYMDKIVSQILRGTFN